MPELDRRQLIEAAGAAAILTTASALSAVSAEAPPLPEVTAMAYDIKPLPFDPRTISGFSEKILTSHHENNYAGAVKRLNAIMAQLASLDFASAPNYVINGLKREELIAGNSMILHEHYFNALAGKNSSPEGKLADAIKRDFGSFDKWRAGFGAMGRAQGGGSGWVTLAYSPRDRRLVNTWAADHTTTLAGGRPVLVMDMYEHSYHMDFGAKAGAYVDAFLAAMKWDDPMRLFDRYAKDG